MKTHIEHTLFPAGYIALCALVKDAPRRRGCRRAVASGAVELAAAETPIPQRPSRSARKMPTMMPPMGASDFSASKNISAANVSDQWSVTGAGIFCALKN